MVRIPASVTTIGPSAFGGCPELIFCGVAGSYAETYAQQNGILFETGEEIVTTVDTTAVTTTTTTTTVITTAEEPVQTTAVPETTAENSKKYFAPVSELGGMAVKDYESKNGVAPASSETKENADGTVTIVLSDADGKVLDTYTIDPVTGNGTDSKGGKVELPQTGNNSVKTVAAAASALGMMLLGTVMAAGSGIFRKKEDE